jgi:glycosyltransferase involved in cell wall biosynthesis
MKILYVITGADIGGAQKHLMDLIQYFKVLGDTVEVVAGEDGPLVDWLTDKNIPVTIIPIPRKIEWKKDWLAFKKLRKHISQNQYDVVHCHSSKAGIIGRLAAYVNRVPKNIFTAHGFVFTDPTLSKKKRVFYIFLERVFGGLSSDIITVSHYDFEAGRKIGLSSRKLHVIHNALPKEDLISLHDWEKKQVVLRNTDMKIIGFVGRLVSEKNVDMIIRLASLFKQNSIFNIKFWLIGDGKLEYHYRKMVQEQDLEDIIIFRGNQTNVLHWMDQMHIQIITSHKEGLPYVLLEAMGRGLPVVSTDVGGVKEVLDPEGKLEVIVPVNGDQMMYERIVELLENNQHREQLGKNMLEQAGECTVEKMGEKTREVYHQ